MLSENFSLQCAFIDAFLQAHSQNFSLNAVKPAMFALAKLCQSDVVILTLISEKNYSDIELTSTIAQLGTIDGEHSEGEHSSDDMLISQAVEQFDNCHEHLASLSSSSEFDVSMQRLSRAIFAQPESYQHISDDQQSFTLVPFWQEQEHKQNLVALLAFKSGPVTNFKTNFASVYQTIGFVSKTIAKQKNAQQQLDTFQMVVDSLPQRVFWKDRHSTYLGCNKIFAEDALLTSTQEIQGLDDFQLFPVDANLYRSDDLNTINTGTQLHQYSEPQTQRQGKKLELITTKKPLVSKEGFVIGVIGTYETVNSSGN